MRWTVVLVVALATGAGGQSLADRFLSFFYRQTCDDLRHSLFEVDTLSDCSETLGCPLNQHCEPFTCQGLFVHRCVSNFRIGASCQRGEQCNTGFCHPTTSTCQPSEGACPEQMLNAGGICLGLPAFRAASWTDARAACPALFGVGAALVSPINRVEQQNLQTFLVLRRAAEEQPYIGISDLQREGEFLFDAGGAPVETFSAFLAEDLALNSRRLSCATHRPVRLGVDQNGWQLSECDGSRRFVCQAEPRVGQ
ncbi:uncharacterized protein LOC122392885 [Amphibalanus amphitrite]|uniref:uncharacterized protein LOC122392885 n=1 Tax=Amphibalanus amphitrite TaxID=1232801 RepID=UPI001C918EEC|nr:uncharacterized protein LOC122392885 [Amphibalanus amphitrite]